MAQNPLAAFIAKTASNVLASLNLDAVGGLRASNGAINSKLNITAATVVKATPGRAVVATVVVAGSAAGTLNDNNSTSGNTSANQFGSLPTTVGSYIFDWPCATGIVVVPGTGQTIALSYA